MSVTPLKDMIDQAKETETEPPRPLQRPLEPADPFPLEALGGILGDAAIAKAIPSSISRARCSIGLLANGRAGR